MTQWWRAYSEALNDPKLQQLPGDLFKTWFNLMCIVAGNVAGNEPGTLPTISEIAFHLRCSVEQATESIEKLKFFGLIDDVDNVLSPHNWHGRQFKSDDVNVRSRAFRERRKAVAGNGDATLHATPPETETETEKKERKVLVEEDVRTSSSPRENPQEKIVEKESKRPSGEGPDTGYVDVAHELWGEGPVLLEGLGIPGEKGKKMIGKWLKATQLDGNDRHEVVLAALQRAAQATPVDPIPWIVRALGPFVTMGSKNGAGTVAAHNAAVIERLRSKLAAGPVDTGDFGLPADPVRGRVRGAGGSSPRKVSP